MRVGIGIDTGGTYTDAVVYDFIERKLVCSAKAQTTREDLSVGIGNALDGLPLDLVRRGEMISLSTTLATNACVENRGGRAKLLFIGVDRKIADWVRSRLWLSRSLRNCSFRVESATPGGVDCQRTRLGGLSSPEAKAWIRDACAVGIVDIDAMDNSAVLEKKAKELITGKYAVPVVCGHELFSDLNSLKRGSSILLNARLIPLIGEFLHATKSALERRAITAPVVIVRSDGSLMSGQVCNPSTRGNASLRAGRQDDGGLC